MLKIIIKIIKYISTTILIIIMILSVFICYIMIRHLNFLIELPYNENERYFDANSGIVYHSQSIVAYTLLVLLCILLIIITIIVIIVINKKMNGEKKGRQKRKSYVCF